MKKYETSVWWSILNVLERKRQKNASIFELQERSPLESLKSKMKAPGGFEVKRILNFGILRVPYYSGFD
jgi:hypothetical protein